MHIDRVEAIPYDEILRVIYYVCFDADFYKGELQRGRVTLPYHIFTIVLAYMSEGITPRGDAVKEAVATFETKTITKACVRLINDLEDRGWAGKGKVGCFVLLEGLYEVPKLRRDLLDAEIASVIVRRSWKCFKNPDHGAADLRECVEISVLHLHK